MRQLIFCYFVLVCTKCFCNEVPLTNEMIIGCISNLQTVLGPEKIVADCKKNPTQAFQNCVIDKQKTQTDRSTYVSRKVVRDCRTQHGKKIRIDRSQMNKSDSLDPIREGEFVIMTYNNDYMCSADAQIAGENVDLQEYIYKSKYKIYFTKNSSCFWIIDPGINLVLPEKPSIFVTYERVSTPSDLSIRDLHFDSIWTTLSVFELSIAQRSYTTLDLVFPLIACKKGATVEDMSIPAIFYPSGISEIQRSRRFIINDDTPVDNI